MSASLDINTVRQEFPVTKRMLYLDSAHQTPMPNCVRSALSEFLVEGNEMAGPKPVWMRRVELAREKVAELLHASSDEIAFTKNTSEGLNIAANAVPLQPGSTVLMLEGDHPNNAYAWLHLKRKGVKVKFVSLPDDQVANASTFADHIDESTRVISLSHVTFHAGQRHDIEDIGRLCARKSIYLVVDAMQSVGVLPVDVKRLGVSVLAAGCHKGLLVPQGTGILYVKQSLQELQPVYLAMSSLANPPEDYVARPDEMTTRRDAGRFEFGNFNLPDLHALTRSIEFIQSIGVANIEEHVQMLGDRLIEGLDELGIGLVGPRQRGQRAHIYVLALPVAKWVSYFTQNLVRVSPERGGVRISFGAFNTPEDVDRLIGLIASRMRKGVDSDDPSGGMD
ncbi:aminotransferase class V-fold PLP-dependent enzyme [Variovorax ginsengisoli]|uniref:Aminotransferase class V-fold PLP-dependent enzyme n=1 Tax=Variovorax ginsengisoli TaxID=363844 RepID=A0ABT8SGX4_9BURK|nr:aminotransferase class V-fold PLP-dependent enzyme [Variovorax ginsengisoli]MDN8618449.1 aminotransferase class V-fold PLP-dependent enzyme [Variovorax ginsengisoli]MDO1537619.1 aminotransferase class V-fold PLP-dependent enzyme [Variovorax ginsengisoli]